MRCPLPRAAFCVVVVLILGLGSAAAAAWLLALRPLPRGVTRSIDSGNGPIFVSTWSYRAFGVDRRVHAATGYEVAGDAADSDWLTREQQAAAKGALARPEDAAIFPAWWGETPDPEPASGPGAWIGSIQDARGWPLPAFSCEWSVISTASFVSVLSVSLVSGRELPATSREWISVRAIPLRPIPLGLAADTVFFGAAWFLLLFGPGFFRRQLRRRRGQCPRCGYSLESLPRGSPCPECGPSAAQGPGKCERPGDFRQQLRRR